MTREEAMFKLLQIGPASKAELHQVTGWGIEATNEVLARLIEQRRVTYRNHRTAAIGHREFMAVPTA